MKKDYWALLKQANRKLRKKTFTTRLNAVRCILKVELKDRGLVDPRLEKIGRRVGVFRSTHAVILHCTLWVVFLFIICVIQLGYWGLLCYIFVSYKCSQLLVVRCPAYFLSLSTPFFPCLSKYWQI